MPITDDDRVELRKYILGGVDDAVARYSVSGGSGVLVGGKIPFFSIGRSDIVTASELPPDKATLYALQPEFGGTGIYITAGALVLDVEETTGRMAPKIGTTSIFKTPGVERPSLPILANGGIIYLSRKWTLTPSYDEWGFINDYGAEWSADIIIDQVALGSPIPNTVVDYSYEALERTSDIFAGPTSVTPTSGKYCYGLSIYNSDGIFTIVRKGSEAKNISDFESVDAGLYFIGPMMDTAPAAFSQLYGATGFLGFDPGLAKNSAA